MLIVRVRHNKIEKQNTIIMFSRNFYFRFLSITYILQDLGINADYAPTGCEFTGGNTGKATCDFTSWDLPLQDSDFGPGDIYQIVIENVDGTIPNQVFSDINSDNSYSTAGKDTRIQFKCNLENIIVSPEVFTTNLHWIKDLSFQNCYVQDGISSGMLSNLTSLEEFTIDGGIVGPLASDVFAELINLVKVTINADFLDAEIPSELFSNLTLLQEIDLKASGISSVPNGLFNNLKLLTKLDLSENSLTTLPPDLFTSLISLSTVELGTNLWDCSCDMAWLSSWSLYTGVSIDVSCTTPSEYSGVSLNRAVASLGCISSATSTATVTVSSGTGDNSGNTDETLTFIALGAAGFAAVLSIVTSTALCCVCNKLRKLRTGDSRRNGRNELRKMNKPEQTRPARQMSVSTVEDRPPSYKSTERMFISTPIHGQRDSKVHPYYNVSYRKGLLTSEA